MSITPDAIGPGDLHAAQQARIDAIKAAMRASVDYERGKDPAVRALILRERAEMEAAEKARLAGIKTSPWLAGNEMGSAVVCNMVILAALILAAVFGGYLGADEATRLSMVPGTVIAGGALAADLIAWRAMVGYERGVDDGDAADRLWTGARWMNCISVVASLLLIFQLATRG